jgi:hypothetical protein
VTAGALSDAERTELAGMWAFRARGEHATAAQYADLAGRLQAAGADAGISGRVAAAAADETRHRELCAGMAAKLRHPPLGFADGRPVRIAPHGLPEAGRIAYEMVALFCVTESINATLLLRSWQRATDEAARAALHSLLADEVEHSRIGWAYLSSEPGWRAELAAGLPIMLGAAIHDGGGDGPFLAARTRAPESPALAAHGLLGQDGLRGVFLEALNDVVLPGLELCGVGTAAGRAWLAGCTAGWAPDPAGEPDPSP